MILRQGKAGTCTSGMAVAGASATLQRVFLGLSLLLLLPGASRGADYYVRPDGSDQNAGTALESAWQTIAKVNAAAFAPGDRILFEGGKSFTGNLVFNAQDSGTAQSPVVITSFGEGPATILAGAGSGISVTNAQGITVSNLKLVGSGDPTNQQYGILFYNSLSNNVKLDGIRIESVEVSGFGNYGIAIAGGNGKSGFSNVWIANSSAHDNGNGGIASWGIFSSTATAYAHANLRVTNCRTYDNAGIASNPSHSGDGIVLGDVDGAVIEYSVAYNNGWKNTANGGPVGIWAWDANRVVIQYNESYQNHTASTTDGGGFDLDGGVTNSTLQYNYSHDNDGAGYLLAQFGGARPFANNVVRYNISQNDGRKNGFAGIEFWNGGSGVKNVDIYNNTIFTGPSPYGSPRALYFMSPTTNVRLWNNIFQTTGGVRVLEAVSGQQSVSLAGNAYWTSDGSLEIAWQGPVYGSVAAWRTATGQERWNGVDTGLQADPKLTAPGQGPTLNDVSRLGSLTAYRLLPTSPLLNVGLNTPVSFGVSAGTRDFYGSSVPLGTGFDIGAHELFAVGPVANQAPVVNAGPAQTITLPLAASLRGSVQDDGLPRVPGFLTFTWTQLSGPGTVRFNDPAAPTTQATLPVPGVYTLALSASDGALTSSSQVVITVLPAPDAVPPTVSVLAPEWLEANRVLLRANATDNERVASVQFKQGNTPLGPPLTVSPYQMIWSIAGLPNGAYPVVAEARDTAGNVGRSAPVPVLVANTVSISELMVVPGPSNVHVQWRVNVPARGQVEYGTTPALGAVAVTSAAFTTRHSVVLRDLSRSQVYYMRVRSQDVAGNEAVSPVQQLMLTR